MSRPLRTRGECSDGNRRSVRSQNRGRRSDLIEFCEDLLFERLVLGCGFDGLLLSDDLDMEALSGTVPERAARAIAAGCDIALNCWASMEDMTGIADLLTAMTPEASARLDRALRGAEAVDGAEQAQLIAKRDALLALAPAAAGAAA